MQVLFVHIVTWILLCLGVEFRSFCKNRFFESLNDKVQFDCVAFGLNLIKQQAYLCFSLEFGVASCVIFTMFFFFIASKYDLQLGGTFLGLLDEIGVFNIKFCLKTPLKVELKQALGSLKLQEGKNPHQKEEPMPSLQRGLPSFFHLFFFHFFLSAFLSSNVALPMPNKSNTNGNYSIKS